MAQNNLGMIEMNFIDIKQAEENMKKSLLIF